MNEYMVIMSLPQFMSAEFINLIPVQRYQLNNLLIKGNVTSYSLAFNRSTLWVTIPAANENEVLNIITLLPLTKFMKIEIVELAFSVNTKISRSQFSLN